MRRTLATLAAALCFVLALATLVLWVRSEWCLDDVGFFTRQHYLSIRSADGRIYVQQAVSSGPFWDPRINYITGDLSSLRYFNLPFRWQIGPFGYGNPSIQLEPGATVTVTAHIYLFPHVVPLLLLLIFPALWTRRFVHRRRAQSRISRGHCPHCGYDLRASEGRCPECGTATPIA